MATAPVTNDLGGIDAALVPDVVVTSDVSRPMDVVVDVAQDLGPITACTGDRDCSPLGLVCNVDQGRCVECNAPTDCTGDLVCLRNRCQPVSRCTSSRTCPGQVCSATLGFCVDCNDDGDCPATQRCRDSACVNRPAMCGSSRDCSAMGLVCSTALRVCVECNADLDCPMGRLCGTDNTCRAQVCTPSETRCEDLMRQRSCDSRGSVSTLSTCAVGQTCRGGRCQAVVCQPGSSSCDPTTGARRVCTADGGEYAAMPCSEAESCRAGVCMVRTCVPGAATCLSASSRNVCTADGLGMSVVACGPSESCRDGQCVARVCTPGAATCVDPTTRSVCNADGLGTSPTACSDTQRCADGVCRALACVPGASTCVDSRTLRACSADGLTQSTLPCPAMSTCSGTLCSSWACVPGSTSCASSTMRNTCGADGLGTTSAACPTPANATAPSCTGMGLCGYSCLSGFGDCNRTPGDGCEVALNTTVAHCGSCGRSCDARANSTVSCVAGACAYVCNVGFADCDGMPANGCEASLTTPMSCGACGTVCPSGQFCVAGRCSVAGPLYHGWTSPVPSCLTTTYNTTAPTNLGGTYPFNTGDAPACRAWKLAATVCTTQPTAYVDNNNFSCPRSGGFTDPTFGTYCAVASQYSCSTCPGACNAGCAYMPLSLRNCAGRETAQP
ncbi:MAG: hypothetical protein Q8S73_34520 [Deltaproteobacteria bacterium]|nr:hypothetical protein [Myxococcales bacterium]MDP3219265.1 hypothetical protein [Deltaproteobacteria bacterium]